MEAQGKLMVKCKICGRGFPPNIESHYKVRDIEVTGLSTITEKKRLSIMTLLTVRIVGAK